MPPTIEETFAEAFPMFVGRVLITAENEKWAVTAAKTATGFGSSIIMSPAEAGMEGPMIPPESTPDHRPGVMIQIYQRTPRDLKRQMILRIAQCVLTCPTTSAFDGLRKAKNRIQAGRAIRLFGDGYEKQDRLGDRVVWRIPVMEGDFVIEDSFGARKGIGGGNFIIMADSPSNGLKAAENAVEAISRIKGVIVPFPGGVCRSGSKVGSAKYKQPASTNHQFCPSLVGSVQDSKLPEGVKSVYEIIINGLNLESVTKAMGAGIRAAIDTAGVVRVSAVNFGGKLGPYHIDLKEALRSA